MSATHRDSGATRARTEARLRLGALAVLLLAAGLSASSVALAHEPVADKPLVHKPAAQKPVAQKPVAQEPAAASGERQPERVELNAAGVEELCTLPGIGPKKAEAIIAFRERQPFSRVTQLLRVRGIGAKTLQRLRPLIYVAPPGRPKPPALSRAEPAAPAPVPGG